MPSLSTKGRSFLLSVKKKEKKKSAQGFCRSTLIDANIKNPMSVPFARYLYVIYVCLLLINRITRRVAKKGTWRTALLINVFDEHGRLPYDYY